MVLPWLRPPLAQPLPSRHPPRAVTSRQSDEYADKAEELVAFQEKLSEGGVQTQRPSWPKKPAVWCFRYLKIRHIWVVVWKIYREMKVIPSGYVTIAMV